MFFFSLWVLHDNTSFPVAVSVCPNNEQLNMPGNVYRRFQTITLIYNNWILCNNHWFACYSCDVDLPVVYSQRNASQQFKQSKVLVDKPSLMKQTLLHKQIISWNTYFWGDLNMRGINAIIKQSKFFQSTSLKI